MPVVLITTKQAAASPNTWQMLHKDFSPLMYNAHVGAHLPDSGPLYYPWTILVMLSDDGYLYVQLASGLDVKIFVPRGAAVLFKGNVWHGGAAYQQLHVRAHFYLVPNVSCYKGIRHDDDWRVNTDGDVALWNEDPLMAWSVDVARLEKAGVALAFPAVSSMTQMVQAVTL